MIHTHENSNLEILASYQKWKKWKLQLMHQKEEQTDENAPIHKPEDDAYNYAKKLIQRMEAPSKIQCPISKKVAQQLQTNCCMVCFMLMIPPNIPMLMFPCGHNICKICLMHKIQTCPLCRAKITNSIQNRNLMKLICAYTNKKQLLEKQLQKQTDNHQNIDNITKLIKHCNLLTNQKAIINTNLNSLKNDKKIMEEVIDRLLQQRKKCRKCLQILEDQSRLINKVMNQKQQELDRISNKISDLQQRQQILLNTLQPLKSQKQHLQFIQAKKLIFKK